VGREAGALAVAEEPVRRDEEQQEGEHGEEAAEVFEPVPYVEPEPAFVPQTWWDKQWFGLVKGTSFDPNEEGKRRSIFGYYAKEGREEPPDLPFLPYGDPPEDAQLPFFDKADFANTTWTVGILWKGGLFKRVERARVFFRDDGKVVWTTGAQGTWSCDSRSNVFRFGRSSPLGLNGGRSFPTLLTREDSRYFMEGFVIGWAPFSPLDVWGMWQAYRDDVSEEERGTAPWEGRDEGRDVVEG
jgi:hypothetical protein